MDGQLWATDGTVEGTLLVDDQRDYDITNLSTVGNKGFFSLNDGSYGRELWLTDGTSIGTHMVKDIDPEGSSNPGDFTAINGFLIFTATVGYNDKELWISDGTEEGTQMLIDLREGNLGSNPKQLVQYKGKLFFVANEGNYGEEIWFLDFGFEAAAKGTVFLDENRNGIQDSGERGVAKIGISGDSASTYTLTDEDGQFQVFLNEGSERISPELGDCWEITSNPAHYTISANGEQSTQLNFGVINTAETFNLKANIHSGPTRCGFTVPFWITAENIGCKPITNGQLGLVLNDWVQLESADQAPNLVTGDTIWWENVPIAGNEGFQVKVLLKMPSEEFNGEILNLQALTRYENDNSELVETDFFYFSSTISCAIDPNDKLVLPTRASFAGENYTTWEEEMEYTIRFQNTGSDTAINIRIEDHLSPLLDWNTFTPGVSSHDYKVNVDKEGLVEFFFANIYLPDSTTNEAASHGFVHFSILPKQEDLDEFDKIENEAAIFFDFNQPIVTNTISNLMVSSLDFDEDGYPLWEDCEDRDKAINPGAIEVPNNGIDEDCDGMDLLVSNDIALQSQIKIYPNPVSNQLAIEYEGKSGNINSSIYTISGRELITLRAQPGHHTIDMSTYPAGVYLLILQSSEKRSVLRIIKH